MPKGLSKTISRSKPRKKAQKKTNSATRGLTKTAKKEVKALIKRSEETKYFDCHDLIESIELYRARANVNAIGVYGFATCSNQNSGGSRIPYGVDSTNAVKYLDPLDMNKTFSNASGTDYEKSQAVVGSYCKPSYAATSFLLERQYVDLTGSQGSDYLANNSAPYFVRILRISPKSMKISNTSINPQLDAFLTNTNEPTGVHASTFGIQALQLFKPNTRKYNVLADIKTVMHVPFTSTTNSTGDISTPSGALISLNNSDNFMKTYNFTHDIGKKLFFTDGGGSNTNSATGQKNEFILIHTCQMGINSYNSLQNNSARKLRIALNTVSTYKE